MAMTTNQIDIEKSNLTPKAIQKLLFISNALDNGWSVKKSKDSYIFTKRHENKREVFQTDYLEKFVLTNAVGDILPK
jgi:hypothetical protein